MRVVEKFYSVPEVALLLGLSTKTVLRKLKDRAFGDQVVNLAGAGDRPDYRVPASGLNAYLDAHRVFAEPGITARSVSELRRKVINSPDV